MLFTQQQQQRRHGCDHFPLDRTQAGYYSCVQHQAYISCLRKTEPQERSDRLLRTPVFKDVWYSRFSTKFQDSITTSKLNKKMKQPVSHWIKGIGEQWEAYRKPIEHRGMLDSAPQRHRQHVKSVNIFWKDSVPSDVHFYISHEVCLPVVQQSFLFPWSTRSFLWKRKLSFARSFLPAEGQKKQLSLSSDVVDAAGPEAAVWAQCFLQTDF